MAFPSGGERSLFFLGKRTSRGGNSYIGLVVTKSEVVITVITKLTDGNALEGYVHTLNANEFLSLQVSSSLECVGKILCYNVGLSAVVEDFNRCVLKFKRAVVDIHRTGNANRHTELNVKIGYGVLIKTVYVVATVNVLNVETVCSIALGLRDNTRNNALNDKEVALFSRCIISKGIFFELGNFSLEFNLDGVAVSVGNGSRQGVGDVSFCSVDNVNKNSRVILSGNRDAGYVAYGPFKRKGNACNAKCADQLVVNGSRFASFLIQCFKIVFCILKAGIFSGSRCSRGRGSNGRSGYRCFFFATSYKSCYAHDQYQQANK